MRVSVAIPCSVRRVCLITKDYPPNVPGGIPRAVQMQAHHLAAVGVEVHVITKSLDGVERAREDNGVLVHEVVEPALTLPLGLYYLEIPLWSYGAAAKFAQLDASIRFDIVEAPDYRGEALHLAPRPETALLVWLHSTLMVSWNCQSGYVRTPADDAWHALEMAALERADLLLAPSQLLLDTTAGFLGDRMRPVELMPYLFDAEQFPERHRERGAGPIRALFYGRLEARKNPELALHAVAAARARGQHVELTLLGQNCFGYREQILAPLQEQLGLRGVSYLPHADVEALRSILAHTDVAILPSRFDNSPLTIFEALSSGIPVITSDRVGTASWIEPENGLLALPIDDPTEFGRRAAATLADPAWMSSGSRAAARMRELFSAETVTERLLGCYDRVMAKLGCAAATVATCPSSGAEPASGEAPDPAPPLVRIPETRRAAVLAFADEVTTDPSLLRAWAGEFDARDEVTLVIYASGWTEEQVHGNLAPAVAAAGLEPDDAADLLALPMPSSAQARARLASGCEAILTRRAQAPPFDRHWTVDGGSVRELRSALGLQRPQPAEHAKQPSASRL